MQHAYLFFKVMHAVGILEEERIVLANEPSYVDLISCRMKSK
jgi:hypothetical protein